VLAERDTREPNQMFKLREVFVRGAHDGTNPGHLFGAGMSKLGRSVDKCLDTRNNHARLVSLSVRTSGPPKATC
jgi:hypothetical protein